MDFDLPRHPLDEEAPSSVVISPHSELGKELLKWEQHPGPLGRNPGNPYVKREYPKMLYRAESHPETGQPTCMQANPDPWKFLHIPDREARAQFYEEACQRTALWNKEHQRIVKDESAHRVATGQGWCESPDAALEQFEQEQQALARAHAEAAFAATRMSNKAQVEFNQAQQETHQHVTDVQPKRRGRKPKAAPVVEA